MDENARKRKREENGEMSEVEGIEVEKPKQGLRDAKPQTKKQKNGEKQASRQTLPKSGQQLPNVDVTRAKAEKRKEKRERRKVKDEARAAKLKVRSARRDQEIALAEDAKADLPVGEVGDSDGDEESVGIHLEPIDISSTMNMNEVPATLDSTATPSPAPQSPIFDASTTQSGTSSISSIAPSTIAASKDRTHHPHKLLSIPQAKPEELKVRLQQRIEALRAVRKADTIDGTPARNRQELMEARRRKEDQRKARKKELRLKTREEELRQRDLALARGSPLLSPAVMSPIPGRTVVPSPLGDHAESSNNFSFGRIAFENGQTMTPNLHAVIDPHRRKGPQDPLTALQAVNKRNERISALDPTKRADIEEKDSWLNARKRAHGERIRDDSSLLKKTLKRKEKAKKKSEKEWGERIEGIEKGKAMRQKKREENLQKRKDEKGVKGKKAKSKLKGAKKGKPKARPGFEGSFRAGGKK